jgi:heme a synthase
VLWTAQQIAPQRPVDAPARLRFGAVAIAVLVLGQIYLGALVAGLDAGLVYNSWPLIDGAFVPDSAHLLFLQPAWRNFFENTLTVQFDHRMLAYLVWLAVMVHANDAWRARREVAGALVLAGAVTLQALLGIITLLNQAPIELALAHQMVAVLTFTVAVVHAERLWHRADMEMRTNSGASA